MKQRPAFSVFGFAMLFQCCLPGRGSDKEKIPETIEFNRDIRPILSETCYTCHGPDPRQRKADLRLDLEEGIFKDLEDGRMVLPGKSDESLLFQRITAERRSKRMPPLKTGKVLTARQIELFRRWIDQGAKWQKHWSFLPPERPPVPAVKDVAWPRNPMDSFILSRLEREGLKPSPEASREAWIRRVTLDLTGLPPTLEEVDRFLSDDSPDAFEKVVDRLLDSPRYGEQQARHWLDFARYADTHGYHIDSHRDMWPWRDWVIRAFNENMPFDRFAVEQMAGDLLPDATLEQKVATGFSRNHMINYEGGAIPEEYHVEYVVDRVNTTATVFLGLTMGCARCHDHKYDPITQRDYYRFFAFFNNVPEKGLDGQKGNADPMLKVPTAEQKTKLKELTEKIQTAEAALGEMEPSLEKAQQEWEGNALAAVPPLPREGILAHYELDGHLADTSGNYRHGEFREGNPEFTAGKVSQAIQLNGKSSIHLGGAGDFETNDPFSCGAWIRPAGKGHMAVIAKMDDPSGFRGYDLYLGDGKVYAHFIHNWDNNAIRINSREVLVPENTWHHVLVTYDGSGKAAGVKLYVDGKPVPVEVTHDRLQGSIRTEASLNIGRRNPGAPFQGLIDEVRIFGRELRVAEVEALAVHHPLHEILAMPAGKRTKEQRAVLRSHYRSRHAPARYGELQAELKKLRKEESEIDKSIPTTMVMEEMAKPRDTFILTRGEYSKPAEKVEPGTPECLPPLPDKAPRNRLGLARWLVDPGHPLTARVAVNRFWQMVFGSGLVKTAENFGSQGEWPLHRELLDWLATEFIRSGWNVKGLHRLIVTSRTYRQSSKVTGELLERDPGNRLLARGPRFRLPAEVVRDSALFVSGLLQEKIGSPSVKPYQPPDLWKDVAYGAGFTAQVYEQDHGENLYRRSMYTFWKRSCPPPSLLIFDAPDREFCVVRRSRTNTPLQALVLLNDPTYVEASRALAQRMMKEGGSDPAEQVSLAFRLATSRRPAPEELNVLTDVFQNQLSRCRKDGEAAAKLLEVGESKRLECLDPAELAARTIVCNMILNLDETITKQ